MVLYRVFRDIVPKIRLRRITTVKNPAYVSLSMKTVDVETPSNEVNSNQDRDGLDKLRKKVEALKIEKKQPWRIVDLIKIPYYILKKVFSLLRWFIMGLISPLRYGARKIFYRRKTIQTIPTAPLEAIPKTEKNDVTLKTVMKTNAQSGKEFLLAENTTEGINNKKEVKCLTRAEKWANAKLKISKFLMHVGAFTCITWIVDLVLLISSMFGAGETGPAVGTRSSFRNAQRSRALARLAEGE